MQTILLKAGQILFQVINIMIIINILLSWFPTIDRRNPLIQLVHNVTEPILSPFRKFAIFGSLDLSPIFAIIVLEYIVYPLYALLITNIF